MNVALIPGSYDPITVGHVDLIRRAAKLYDTLYVGVMINNSKKYLFTTDERIELAKKALSSITNVKVVSSDGLTVDLCKELNCNVLLKGVRTNQDYEYELGQANINMMMNEGLETLLMLSKPEYSSISSSTVKDIYTYHGDISKFIPAEILPEVLEKLESR